MKAQPLVSVALFTYNGAAFLEKQLDSIYAQTYPNLEVVACDDGSSDDTVRLLESYKNRYGLQYHCNAQNLGLNKNVERTLSLCSGDLIAPCDQDDIWFPEKIELLVDEISDHTLAYSRSMRIDADGNAIDQDYYRKTEKLVEGSNPFAFLFGNCAPGHTMLFKKSLLKHILPMPPDIMLFDKWIMFVASLTGSVTALNQPLVYYRQHDSNTTRTTKERVKSPINRFVKKDREKLAYYEKQLAHLHIFNQKVPADHPDKKLLESVVKGFASLPGRYHARELQALLLENSSRVFAMEDASRYVKMAHRMARGLWYFRARLYL